MFGCLRAEPSVRSPKRGFAAPAPEPEKAEPRDDTVEDAEPMKEQGTDLEDMDPSSDFGI